MKTSLFSLKLFETPSDSKLFDSLVGAYRAQWGMKSQDELDAFCANLRHIFQFLVKESVWYHEKPSVTVTCYVEGDCLTVEMKDKALPWRQSELERDLKAAVLQDQPILIDRLMLFNLGKNGRLLQIKKFIPDPPVLQKEAQKEAEKAPKQIVYRQLVPNEADKAVDCMVIAYGYDYGIPDVYDVGQTRRLMEQKLVYTLAAQTELEEIAGISTLRRRQQSSKIADLCQTMVNPKFMQKKLFENLLSGVIDIADRQLESQGLSATIPNKHYVSQKKLSRLGFQPTGILLGCVPAIVMPKQIGTHLGDRESFLMVYKPLRSIPVDTLYVPEVHAATVQKICDSLEFFPTLLPLPYIDIPEQNTTPSQIKIHEVENLNWAIIEIQSCGVDVVERVLALVEQLKIRGFRAIQLYLDLSDAVAANYIAKIEALGFFFAGFFPDEKPYLVLQHLNNVVVRFDELSLPMSGADVVQEHVEFAHDKMCNGRLSPQLTGQLGGEAKNFDNKWTFASPSK